MGKELLTLCLFDGNINADVFYAWVTQDLLKQLPNNSLMVMDNATFHKRNDIIEAIQAKGHEVLFLPPYSPDLNPIERKWTQLKRLRRKLRCNPCQLFDHIYD